MKPPAKMDGVPVPNGQLNRAVRLGALGARLAGGILAEGGRRFIKGERPRLRDLMLTPRAAMDIAEEFGRLRGAVMKLGQMISMDAGEFLPPEFTDALASLRSAGHAMPAHQLEGVLRASWGAGWRNSLRSFEMQPFAAASIGQVHRAVALDGRQLAIKVQYPGVLANLESDVDTAGRFVAMSGVLPPGLEISALLQETKTQLRAEADYEREARSIRLYRSALTDRARYLLPEVEEGMSTANVLAMTYVEGAPLDHMVRAPQADRDRIVTDLFALCMEELLNIGLVQTDPNTANFLVCPRSGALVLLDFGAVREVDRALSSTYRRLLAAAVSNDWAAASEALLAAGFVPPNPPAQTSTLMRRAFETAIAPLQSRGPFDFGSRSLGVAMRDQAFALRTTGFNHLPPPITLFLHRKIGGVYLIATMLGARVDLRRMAEAYL
jgi:predicted unusual protein kinase regulating ubiquinone biosynthesis (AarF/ABC1/UbiB family)